MAIITQVCLGTPREIEHAGETLSTGIFKSETKDTIEVELLTLKGDKQVDLRYHGGRDKAIYVYPQSQYNYWSNELDGKSLEPAFFGENLVIDEIADDSIYIGSRYRLGSAEVIVAQPRIPCFKLGIRTGMDDFPARFLLAGWLGFYLRVEVPGQLKVGDSFELIEKGANDFTIREIWQQTFTEKSDPESVRQILESCPYLDEGWKKRLRRKTGE